jgi:hypothetical protein
VPSSFLARSRRPEFMSRLVPAPPGPPDGSHGPAPLALDAPRPSVRRTYVRRAAGVAASLSGASVAIWAMPASAHLVGWEGSAARRIALVAPVWLLSALLLTACLIAAGIVRGSREDERPGDRLAPLRWLWLLALPYLPWLPRHLPQLLLFDGPLGWVLCGAVLLGVIGQGLDLRRLWGLAGRCPRWVAVALVATAYAALGWHATRSMGPGGDEPHYLVIAQSLLADGDIRIENQHRERQYAPFFRGEIRPHFLKRGLDEVIYSIHAPGLPALALPAYALGGYRGALLWLALVAAIGAAAMFEVARRVGGIEVAWLTCVGLACSVPFAPHAWLFFPEMPAATIVAVAVVWLSEETRERSVGTWVARGALLGLLPWLHTKFVVLLVGLMLGLACRLWPRRRAIASVAIMPFVSGVLWLYAFYVMYGVPDPTVAYGAASSTVDLSWGNVPRGILGWIFDQEFGFLLYSPVLLIAPLGAWYLARRPEWRLPIVVVSLTAVAFAISVARVYMWWGGWSVPGRFMVPVVPLLAPLLAGLLAAWARTWRARIVSVAVAWGLLALVWTLADPERQLLFNARDATGRWLSIVEGSASLTLSWPTYYAVDWFSQWPRTAGLSAGLLCFWVTVAGMERKWPSRSVAEMLPRGIGVGLLSLGAVSGLAIDQQDRPRLAANGRMDLLDRRVHSQLAAVDPDTFRAVPAGRILETVALKLPAASPEPRFGRIAGPFHLVPGRYELRAWGLGQQVALPSGTTLALEYHTGDGLVARVRGPQANPVTVEFELPVALGDLWVTLRAAHAPAFRMVEIRPLRVDRQSGPDVGPPYHIRPLEGVAGAFVVGLDDGFYVEGDGGWVRGEREAAFLIAGGRVSQLRVRVGNGPVAQHVRVTIAGRERLVALPPNGDAAVELALPADGRPFRVVVGAPSGFRPSDHDPAAHDKRWLGCRVEIEGS